MVEKALTDVARKLRRNMTGAETTLWARLRATQLDGFKFVRQFPIGPYVTDFCCRSANLVIELDGGQHATSDRDAKRTLLIQSYGYHIIRFWNHDVLANLDGVLETIRSELKLARNL